MINKADIEKLSTLSRIALSEEEKDAFVTEIDAILEYVSQVKDVSVAVGTADLLVSDVFREDDEPHESGIYTEDILASAPKREGNFIAVKKILPS